MQPLPQGPDDRVQLLLLFGSPVALRGDDRWQPDLQRVYPHAYQLGCSTAGEIYGTQVLDEHLIVTAIAFDSTQVKGAHVQLQPGEDSFSAGQRLGQALDSEDLVHVFLLSDGLQVNGSDLVRGITQALPETVSLTGGLSGDGDRFCQTWVAWNGTIASGSIAAIGLYGSQLRVGYGSLGGWSPFGTERLITRSEGNVLYELDHRPALALYKQYLGDHAAGLPATGLLFPLSIHTPGSPHRVVRTILSMNEADQSLTFAGEIPQGSTAQLMHAGVDRLIDGAISAAEICRDALGHHSAELAILISCVGRKLILQQRIEEEVEEVQEILGEQAVLTGFYSYGEISPMAPGVPSALHNQTMTVTTFAESKRYG